MWKEVILLAASCVLFVNMGLSEAIQETIGIRLRIASCPKCLVFWLTVTYLVFSGCRILTAVGASFLFSYAALWADLGLSMLNRKYNELCKQLSGPGAKDGSGKGRRRKAEARKDHPGVSEVRAKQR